MKYKLVKEENGQSVNIGDRLLTFRGEFVEIIGSEAPHHSGSTGCVYVMSGGGSSRVVFPSVIGCKIVPV